MRTWESRAQSQALLATRPIAQASDTKGPPQMRMTKATPVLLAVCRNGGANARATSLLSGKGNAIAGTVMTMTLRPLEVCATWAVMLVPKGHQTDTPIVHDGKAVPVPMVRMIQAATKSTLTLVKTKEWVAQKAHAALMPSGHIKVQAANKPTLAMTKADVTTALSATLATVKANVTTTLSTHGTALLVRKAQAVTKPTLVTVEANVTTALAHKPHAEVGLPTIDVKTGTALLGRKVQGATTCPPQGATATCHRRPPWPLDRHPCKNAYALPASTALEHGVSPEE